MVPVYIMQGKKTITHCWSGSFHEFYPLFQAVRFDPFSLNPSRVFEKETVVVVSLVK